MRRLVTCFLVIGLLGAVAVPVAAQSSTGELLSGMVTEEVEPGVFRVVHDGVRDVGSTHSVNVGYDGSVWLFGGVYTDSEYQDRPKRFMRLGSDGSYPWPEYSFWGYDFEVAPDGTMWVIRGKHEGPFASSEGRWSADGEEWTVQRCPQGRFCRAFTVAPDGRVWASWLEEDGRYRVGHLGPTGWQPLDGYARTGSGSPFKGYDHLHITDIGDVYAQLTEWGSNLWRYEDGEWEPFSGLYGVVDVGRDGTVWHDIADEEDADTGLYRFADGEWARWTPDDLPASASGFALGHEPGVHDHEFRVAPDGSLWFSLWQQGADGTDPSLCDGLARFDGKTLDRFLRGRCTSSMDIAPDGSVWLRTGSHDGTGLYVITPEAVAPAETVAPETPPAEASPSPSAGAYVTGTVVSREWAMEGPWPAPEEVGGASHYSDMRTGQQVEWSDPRLPSTMLTVTNLGEHPDPSDVAIVQTWTTTHRLEGPDGAWTGTGRGVNNLTGVTDGPHSFIVLRAATRPTRACRPCSSAR